MIRKLMSDTSFGKGRTDKQLSAKISRHFRLLRIHGIIRKLPNQKIFEGKQVFIYETTGEKMVTIAKNTMDLNPKAGQITVQGYGVTTDPNGDKLIRKHEGKAIGKGHMKGTWSWVKGTGKYEGTTGGGTWESWSLAPQIGYYEVEGDMVIPKQ